MSDRVALIEEIRRLAAGGHTSRAISEQIGVTRNTVIGLCRRRKIRLLVAQGGTGAHPGFKPWTGEDNGRLLELREQGVSLHECARIFGRYGALCTHLYALLRRGQVTSTERPDVARITAEWPGARECRWIEGDVKPAPHWCKRRTDVDRSYCDDHHAIVWFSPPRKSPRFT